MRLKSLLIPLAMASCAGLAAQSALAGPSGYPEQAAPAPSGYVAGTVIIRVGASFVDPEEDAFSRRETFLVDNPDTDITESIPVDVLNQVDLDDETTWQASLVWLFADHWGVELFGSFDASHDADLYSAAFSDGVFIGDFRENIGEFDGYTTSLYINWFPLDPSCLWQPYVGIGASYTDFEDDTDFKRVRSVFRDSGDRHGVLSLGSDFGWTAQVGVDVVFGRDDSWLINASAMYVDSQPDLHMGFDTLTDVPGLTDPAVLPVRIRSDFDYDPWIFNLGVGYKFSF